MSEDYESSALRHRTDALILQRESRWDNAGHLIGFAAECAIKHAIASFCPGVELKQVHLPALLISARKQFNSRSKQAVLFNVLTLDLLRSWAVERRYDATGSTTQAEVEKWVSDTNRIFGAAQLRVKR